MHLGADGPCVSPPVGGVSRSEPTGRSVPRGALTRARTSPLSHRVSRSDRLSMTSVDGPHDDDSVGTFEQHECTPGVLATP